MNKWIKYLLASVILLTVAGYVLRATRGYWLTPPLAAATKARPPAVPRPAAGNPPPPAPASQGGLDKATPKFSELGQSDRRAKLQEIRQKDLGVIFQLWLAAGRVEHDRMKQRDIGTLLGRELRYRTKTDGFYAQLQAFLQDDANPLDERGQLLLVVRETRTSAALDLLIQTATISSSDGLRATAIAAIQTAGALWGDGKFHEELAPALDQLWGTSHDPLTLGATARAMAGVGAASSIRLLLVAAIEPSSSDNVRQQFASNALSNILNPSAVPVLAAALEGQAAVNSATKLASTALSEMNEPAAAQALLGWLESADASVAPLAQALVTDVRMPNMLKAYQAALDPTVPFKNEQVREAIRAGLAQYHRDRH